MKRLLFPFALCLSLFASAQALPLHGEETTTEQVYLINACTGDGFYATQTTTLRIGGAVANGRLIGTNAIQIDIEGDGIRGHLTTSSMFIVKQSPDGSFSGRQNSEGFVFTATGERLRLHYSAWVKVSPDGTVAHIDGVNELTCTK